MDPVSLVVLVLLLLIAFALIGLTLKLAWALLVGLIIGTIAKAVLPGRQDLGWFSTALAGIAGSVVGSLIGHRVLDTGWLLTLVVEVACAAGVIALISRRQVGR
jgi:uncharacterized membrane protein YeaQ/YmgE (transglycosylase-associated protein family)